MKCQHCGSDDIVPIQGQNYCLNCGEPVAATTTQVEVPPVAEAPSVAVAAVVPAAAVSASKSAAGLVAQPLAAAVVKAPKRKPRPLKAKPRTKSAGHKAKAKSPRPTTSVKPTTPEPVKAVTTQAPRARPLQGTKLGGRPHPFRFSVATATLLGVLVGVVTAASLWFQLDTGLALYVIGISAVAAFGLMALAQAALYYGLARSLDGRPTPRSLWWAAARGGFMDVLNVRIMSLISITILVGLGFAGWRLGVESGLAQPVLAVLLVALNLALIWAALGVYIAERMAMPAVVVGGLAAAAALRVGWRLYLKGGGHLLITGFEALVGRLAVVTILLMGVVVILRQAPSTTPSSLIIVGTSVSLGLICFAIAMVILEVDVTLWLRQYRHWAARLAPAERLQLLTGRIQARSQS
jgi:hypothetical protein